MQTQNAEHLIASDYHYSAMGTNQIYIHMSNISSKYRYVYALNAKYLKRLHEKKTYHPTYNINCYIIFGCVILCPI